MLDLNYKLECIKKLKAGHKVLIMGNHDAGASKYKRIKNRPTQLLDGKDISICPKCGGKRFQLIVDSPTEYGRTKGQTDKFTYDCSDCGLHIEDTNLKRLSFKENDNHLFEEVYEGTLLIGPKIILSHEPVEYSYGLNIHGHNHTSNQDKDDLHFNAIAECTNYMPISLEKIIESKHLNKITDVHRKTIDKATKTSKKNKKAVKAHE